MQNRHKHCQAGKRTGKGQYQSYQSEEQTLAKFGGACFNLLRES